MNNKKIAIVAVAAIAIIITSLGAVSAFELFGKNFFGPTTDFETKFMSGTFNGDVIQNKIEDFTYLNETFHWYFWLDSLRNMW